MNKVTAAFAGGGTGGHIYPGLAVAARFRALCDAHGVECRIVWLGSKSGMDCDIVTRAKDEGDHHQGCRVPGSPSGFAATCATPLDKIVSRRPTIDKFYGIHAGKLRRYFSWKNAADMFRVVLGFFDAVRVLARERPDVLFSKGGFVSVPPVMAARLLHIKSFTHECDFTPGLATRLNAKAGARVLVTYPQTVNCIAQRERGSAAVTGNPVREAFYHADKERGLSFLGVERTGEDTEKPIILFMGGSQGASQINQLVKDNIEWLCERFIVVHQTGKDGAVASVSVGGTDYHPYEFIYDEMPDVMAAADIAVTRAGAGAIWECAVLKKPMVLIPLCGEGTRGDQVDNAKYFESMGAAVMLCGEDANSEKLRAALEGLTAEKRSAMAAKCAEMTAAKPADTIAQMIYDEVALKL